MRLLRNDRFILQSQVYHPPRFTPQLPVLTPSAHCDFITSLTVSFLWLKEMQFPVYNCISSMWLYFQAQLFWALRIDHIGHLWPCEHRALLHLTSEIFNLRIYHPFGMVSEVLIYLIILIFYLIPPRISILPATVTVAIKVWGVTGLAPYFYSTDGTAFRTVDDRLL